MPAANLTPLTSIVSATGWTGGTTANLNTSDNARATGGNVGEQIIAELTDPPADYASLDNVTFTAEWLLSATATRAKNLLLELVSADGATIYASWATPARTGTAEAIDNSGALAPAVQPADRNALVGARLRITVQEGGGMADSATVSIDHVTLAMNYTAAAVNQAPNTPSVTGATQSGTDVTLTSSAFSDPDAGDTHQASYWRVRTA